MRITHTQAVLLVLVAVSCGGTVGTQEPIPAAWIANLQPKETDSPLTGFASMSILASGQSRANLTISNAIPATSHDWRIRMGSCDDPGQPLGPESAYPRLDVYEDGRASGTATLEQRLANDQKYSISVSRWGDDPVEIACGDFARS